MFPQHATPVAGSLPLSALVTLLPPLTIFVLLHHGDDLQSTVLSRMLL